MVRKANLSDIPELLRVFNKAKEYMKSSGNPNQWGSNYPPLEDLESEIKEGIIYVFENEDKHIYATFLLMDKPEPTYSYIEDGKWLDNSPYATIHRVASDGTTRGVFTKILEYASSKYNHLRIDTHNDNLTMQHLVEKHGFKYCGIIYLTNGDKRLAYEFIL